MDNFVLIGVCILAGMLLRATHSIHPDAHKGINTWILYLALPAVSFKYLPQVHWSWHTLFPTFGVLISVLGGWLWMWLYARVKGYSMRSCCTLQIVSGYPNTSFIGFPLVAAFFGEQYLSIAIIADQMMFFLLSSFGIITALRGGGQNGDGTGFNAHLIARRLFTFPPFLGCISALVLSHFVDLRFAEPFFGKLAATVGPLALFSVGLQLKFNGWRKLIPQMSVALLYKLLVAPLAVLLLALLLGIKDDVAKIAVFEVAMPTVLTASIIAEQFRLNTKLTNLTIGFSIILGFASVTLWYHVIAWVL